MSTIRLNGENALIGNLQRELGEKTSPIWLVVNPKYTIVRQDIWRPILEEIQDKVYRELSTRIDASNIYIRTAVSDIKLVPKTLNWWGYEAANEIEMFRELVHEYQPKIIISFGAFPYEFVRRVCEIKPEKGPKSWTNAALEEEFNIRIMRFNISKTNRIPLLRRVIETDKFLETENYFYTTDKEIYFKHVGTKIAEKIIEYKESLDIWIK